MIEAARRSALAAGLALLTACAPADLPTVEAGTGVVQFDPVTEGRDLSVVCGSQGGQHIWVSLRTTHTGERLQSAVIGLRRTDGTPVCAQNLPAIDLVPGSDGQGGGNLTGLICFVPDPAAIDGVTLELHAEIVDGWGRAASDSRNIVAHAPDPPCR